MRNKPVRSLYACAQQTASKREWMIRFSMLNPKGFQTMVNNSKNLEGKFDEKILLKKVKKFILQIYEQCKEKAEIEVEVQKVIEVKLLYKWFTGPRQGTFWPEERYLEQWIKETTAAYVPPILNNEAQ